MHKQWHSRGVLLDVGIKIVDVKEGKGPACKKGARCAMKYVGRLSKSRKVRHAVRVPRRTVGLLHDKTGEMPIYLRCLFSF